MLNRKVKRALTGAAAVVSTSQIAVLENSKYPEERADGTSSAMISGESLVASTVVSGGVMVVSVSTMF